MENIKCYDMNGIAYINIIEIPYIKYLQKFWLNSITDIYEKTEGSSGLLFINCCEE